MSIQSQRSGVLAMLVLLAVTLTPALAQPQDAASLWGDFNHYVLVARPDLAQAAASQLLKVDDQALLDIVEASDYANYGRTLERAAKIETLGTVAQQLDKKIQQARIDRSREPQRIADDIQRLSKGQRPYRNALARLKAAGQYAAPQLLATLRDEEQAALHPYVLQAMVAIGRPIIAPLSTALPELDAVNQGRIAQVLAEIGYPHPLAQLKQILEDPNADADVQKIVRRSYEQLIERTELPSDLSAAMLYLLLGESQYRHATAGQELAGYDAPQDKGIVWAYGTKIGLIPIPVPGAVYGDVLAMRSAENALLLDPSLDRALSLYLMANFRRENNLPDGAADPSYGSDKQVPTFYALLAGPDRLQEVLAQALADRDSDLAIDAIEVLSQTAGIKDQIRSRSEQRPLLAALSSPDRRVRFHAAAALTTARPSEAFDGSFRVVPVLAEALRPNDTQVALVLASDQQQLNDLIAAVDDLGYDAISGLSLAGVADQVTGVAGVDVIIAGGNVAAIEQLLTQTRTDYRLGAVPVLAVVTPAQQIDLNARHANDARLTTTLISAEAETLTDTIDEALTIIEPQTLSEEEATAQAFEALRLLANVALASEVYRVEDALPALIASLGGSDETIVIGTGIVLSRINHAEAQSALVESSLKGAGEVQVALLESLADSASHFGNQLTSDQTDRVLKLMLLSTGDTAIAAARAHGALALPTSNSVQEILK